MESKPGPIVAIVGSVRQQITGEKEKEARLAAKELGTALAKAGWRIAVYGSHPDFVERDVVAGYVAAAKNIPKSIICTYPERAEVDFSYVPDSNIYLDMYMDTSEDWEVSFYRSISSSVDALLLFGGAQSAFVTGQISVQKGIPVVAVAHFGGAARKIWRELSNKQGIVDGADIQAMGQQWSANSSGEVVASLQRQYDRYQQKLLDEKKRIMEIERKAQLWDNLKKEKEKKKAMLAIAFLVAFLVCFLIGLTASFPAWIYISIAVLGLCAAGGMGATLRMLAPKPPESASKWSGPIIGVMVGLVATLLYLIPQLVQQSGFLIASAVNNGISDPIRTQFICSMVVAVLAGLGFDYTLEQLVKRSHQEADKNVGQSI